MKRIILVLSLLLISLSLTLSFKENDHKYTFTLPENLIQPFWQVIHGNVKQITIAQYEELIPLLEQQLSTQLQTFQLQDSLKRKDSTTKKLKLK